MAFSIPAAIYPKFHVPDTASIVNGPKVGLAIKDVANDQETTNKRVHAAAVARITEQYKADDAQYSKDFTTATIKAEAAKKVIGSERFKKVLAITALVATIIGIVGAVIATAVTGTLPLLFIAVPFVVGLVPASYYTHIFRKSVDSLDADIARPSQIRKPVLYLPEYNMAHDFELKQSRESAVNVLSSKSTLRQVYETRYTTHDIVQFALLERMTQAPENKRPQFYAKVVELINAMGKADANKAEYKSDTEREFYKLDSELAKWNQTEQQYISSQELKLATNSSIHTHTTFNRRNPKPVRVVSAVVGTATAILTRMEIDRRKTEVLNTYIQRNQANRAWKSNLLNKIDQKYTKAIGKLETQFANAKIAASA
ncbi:MAG: hypothetical protein LLF94_03420 [Chlamydiales bacterium]|nr:hypothetical protein [Chlamydiales bacterium]